MTRKEYFIELDKQLTEDFNNHVAVTGVKRLDYNLLIKNAFNFDTESKLYSNLGICGNYKLGQEIKIYTKIISQIADELERD